MGNDDGSISLASDQPFELYIDLSKRKTNHFASTMLINRNIYKACTTSCMTEHPTGGSAIGVGLGPEFYIKSFELKLQ